MIESAIFTGEVFFAEVDRIAISRFLSYPITESIVATVPSYN